MQALRLVTVMLALLALNVSVARAERPIVDLHRLDADFQLFAGDNDVPWKPATVRLDTYSSAPVAVAVYAVDPADVLTAGANFSPRAIDVSRRRPLLTFGFTPPGGYEFQSNRVDVPLGSREGFFVVEARRGDVAEQVWINRTRIGLLSKETPGGFLFYAADLGTGLPLSRMRVQFVAADRFVTSYTAADGIVRWNRSQRPVFALAQWGSSYAFLSLLPQAPVPGTIVGVRVDSAVVHGGGTIRVAGFTRRHAGGVLRPGSGSALVTLREGARTIVSRRVPIDEAGAFAAILPVPEHAAAGDDTVLAQADGGAGGATVHVDANAGELSLKVASGCSGICDWREDVPLVIRASRPGVSVRVWVVRSPHVYPAGDASEDESAWATSPWLQATVQTGAAGVATLRIPHPLDQLASTYGVHVESGGATADTRIAVPTAAATIRLRVDRTEQSSSSPLRFSVDAERLDGRALAGATVTVSLAHGGSVQQQQLVLDAQGQARGSFTSPELGTDLLFASVDEDGRATDAAQVQVDPQAPTPAGDDESSNVRIALNASLYRSGEAILVDASAPGAQGEALLTYESALGVQSSVARVENGRAVARFRATDAAGAVLVGAAFVHDGSLQWATLPVTLWGAGRPHLAPLRVGSEPLRAGEPARLALEQAAGGRGTIVVRVSSGMPSGDAVFASAPQLLDIGLTTTQNSAPDAVTWHPWVDSSGKHPEVLNFVARSAPPDESLAQAATDTLTWKIVRNSADGVTVEMPQRAGRYLVSLLDISDDGSVSAASSPVEVR